MVLARRQTADRFDEFFTSQFSRFADSEPFDHLRQRRTASQGRWTTVSKKARGFNASAANAQAKA